jgi:tRNA threonylcarbamoyladenosine biosynthesis protein TsaE
MNQLVLHVRSVAQTAALARRLGASLRPGDIVALQGPLGAGKTTFARALAAVLGVDATAVSSPTFTLCHLYEGRSARIAHLDAYRLAGEEDLVGIGWDELLGDPATIIIVEWADRVASALPAGRTIQILIDHEGPRARRFTMTAPHACPERLVALRTGQPGD